jgi:Protein of unknown function (DUF2971)
MGNLSDAHPALYHYTTLQGVQGIAQHQTLWATHWRYLNDAVEISAFRDRLPELLAPAVREGIQTLLKVPANQPLIRQVGGEAAVTAEVLRGIVVGTYEALLGNDHTPAYIEPFLLSFSTPRDSLVAEHGLLSQWRAYGQDGGYAVVFDTARLGALLNQEAERWCWSGFLAGDVVYSSDPPARFTEEFGEQVDLLRSEFKQFLASAGDHDLSEHVFSALVQCACRYKHWGFHEEREVRLVVIPPGPDVLAEGQRRGLKTDIRPQHHFMRGEARVPCLHLFEGIARLPDKPLPITRVIVGPHRDQRQRRDALENDLHHLKVDVAVTMSEIPYVGRF